MVTVAAIVIVAVVRLLAVTPIAVALLLPTAVARIFAARAAIPVGLLHRRDLRRQVSRRDRCRRCAQGSQSNQPGGGGESDHGLAHGNVPPGPCDACKVVL